MNDRAFNRLNSTQKYNLAKRAKAIRVATMCGSGDGLEKNLSYYNWSMTHDAYTGALNSLGKRVEAEKLRRAQEREGRIRATEI